MGVARGRVGHLDAIPVLVDEPVVMRAEEDQIVEVGRTAVGPVPDVVGIEPACVRAPGERAAVATRA